MSDAITEVNFKLRGIAKKLAKEMKDPSSIMGMCPEFGNCDYASENLSMGEDLPGYEEEVCKKYNMVCSKYKDLFESGEFELIVQNGTFELFFEGRLNSNLGNEIIIRPEGNFSVKNLIEGVLIQVKGNYYVKGYGKAIPLENVSSTKEDRLRGKIDVELDSYDFFGGLLK